MSCSRFEIRELHACAGLPTDMSERYGRGGELGSHDIHMQDRLGYVVTARSTLRNRILHMTLTI